MYVITMQQHATGLGHGSSCFFSAFLHDLFLSPLSSLPRIAVREGHPVRLLPSAARGARRNRNKNQKKGTETKRQEGKKEENRQRRERSKQATKRNASGKKERTKRRGTMSRGGPTAPPPLPTCFLFASLSLSLRVLSPKPSFLPRWNRDHLSDLSTPREGQSRFP